MATLPTLISDLRDLTRTTSTDLTDARGTRYLNRAMERMQDAHNWRGQEFSLTTVTYGPSDDGIALPADFISEEALWRQMPSVSNPSGKLRPVDKLPARRDWWQRVLKTHPPNEQRFPASSTAVDDGPYYYLWEQKLFYNPNPNQAVNLTLDYYRRLADLALTTNESNFFTVVTPTVLLWGALPEAWAFLHEDERIGIAEARFALLLGQAIKNDRQLAASGGPRSRGT